MEEINPQEANDYTSLSKRGTGEGPLLLMENDYSDIINLEHPTSKRHPRMSMMQRAAQFAPFAALTGHSEAIDETARKNEDNIAQQDAYVDE